MAVSSSTHPSPAPRGRAVALLAAIAVAAATAACSSTPAPGPARTPPATTSAPPPATGTTTSAPPPATTSAPPRAPASAPPPATAAGDGTSAGMASCTSGQLAFSVAGTNGAAGTIADAVRVTNTGPGSCWTYGYVGLTIIDRAGHRLPTTTVRGAGLATVPDGPRRVTLPRGAWAWFALVYHDSAPPSCTNPPAAGTHLAIIAPDTTQPRDLALDTVAACGRINVSPMLAASTWRPADWATP